MKDGVLQCFKHILFSTPDILANGKPSNASQEDWDFALQALLALLDS